MFKRLLGRILDNNDSKISKLQPIVDKINSLESKYKKLKDSYIKKQTKKWQDELRNKKRTDEEIKQFLDDLLPDAFALVREASKRSVGQRHRDVQLLAGIVLHQGKIAEQKTGEGKTLTATLPLYLNSLAGKGAHLVTPNDYLSKHAPGWYGSVYELLGISVGVNTRSETLVYDSSYVNESAVDEYSKHLKPVSKLDVYLCDITYGTMSEFGFDYLRDNMAKEKESFSQLAPIGEFGLHNFAIVDEVDNILIDIARTPLIISSTKDMKIDVYYKFAKLAEGLLDKIDYEFNEKERYVNLSELGIRKIERKLGVQNLYEKDFLTIHHIENALKAEVLYQKDKDYVVKDGKVIIIDQNTGRLLPGNRWSKGLHQAVEAKEGVQVESESKTVASISYQNYYRLYKKLAGMTGTAVTEAEEFFKMYSLDVIAIPTNKSIVRMDKPDLVFKTQAAKFKAVAHDIAERHKKGQPILIGTTSVEKSQLLSSFLKKLKISHQILNAKQNEKEAEVVAQAGRKGSVTVATNMAGRGVDIILGGDPYNEEAYKEVIKFGGLYVIGTERHDSRRIDNQLRGRSGRQGDVGESRFYLSLQDDLMRIFGGAKVESLMTRLGVDENTPIEARVISKTIENAQKKVEGINFDQRRSVVEYDDVMNVQRESVYKMRKKILFVEKADAEEFSDWILNSLSSYVNSEFKKVWDVNLSKYKEEVWLAVVKQVILEVIDVLWMDHIDMMDDLKSSVGLRAYGQVDPLVEYKKEGRKRYDVLINQVWNTVADRLSKVEIQVTVAEEKKRESGENVVDADFEYSKSEFNSGVLDEADLITNDGSAPAKKSPIVNKSKIKRNDPCPCGSGKKYKHCHGKRS